MHPLALLEETAGEVGAILACNPENQSNLEVRHAFPWRLQPVTSSRLATVREVLKTLASASQ